VFDWRRHRKWSFAILALAAPGLFLLWEHFHGTWALARWKRQLISHGEKLTIEANTPAPAKGPGQNQFRALLDLGRVPDPLLPARLVPPGFLFQSAGHVFTINVLTNWTREQAPAGAPKDDWQTLRLELANGTNRLEHARALLRQPVLEPNFDYSGLSRPMMHLAPLRSLAQHLKLTALLDVHDGRWAEATGKIRDILQIARVLQKEPLVHSQTTCHTIIDGALQATWQLLQADSTRSDGPEAALAELQRAWQSSESIKPMLQALEMERALSIDVYSSMRSSVNLTVDLLISFGRPVTPTSSSSADSTEPLIDYVGYQGGQMLGRGVYVPIWQFAWSQAEELDHLECVQLLIDAARVCVRDASAASTHLATQEYTKRVRPSGGWLQHWQRLMFHALASGLEQSFKRAINADAERELAVAAIAIQRYKLQYGKPPATLATLVPEFVPVIPQDVWSGRPLSYRADSTNGVLLYSVGSDGQDNGGDATPSDSLNAKLLFLEGHDIVWPRPAAPSPVPSHPSPVPSPQ
jgi:hypothetical protein